MEPFTDNPVQFLTNARLRLYCADVLSAEDLFKLLVMLKEKTNSLLIDTAKYINRDDANFYHRLVYDNLNCEYKNFLQMLEGIERACNR